VDVDAEKEAKKKKKVKVHEATKLDDATIKEYEETLAKIGNYSGEELGQLTHCKYNAQPPKLKKYNIKGPTSGAELEPPRAFNLMFQTTIGPSAEKPNGYLRPETAQGQFLNFQKLLEFNQQSMVSSSFDERASSLLPSHS